MNALKTLSAALALLATTTGLVHAECVKPKFAPIVAMAVNMSRSEGNAPNPSPEEKKIVADPYASTNNSALRRRTAAGFAIILMRSDGPKDEYCAGLKAYYAEFNSSDW